MHADVEDVTYSSGQGIHTRVNSIATLTIFHSIY